MAVDETERTSCLVEVADLTVDYVSAGGPLRALDGVSLNLSEGEILGVVGEASSGKSTLLQAIVGALSRNAIVVSGAVRLGGRNLLSGAESELRLIRGSVLGYIPSGGHAHLNPVRKVGEQIADALQAHQRLGRRDAHGATLEALRRVGIDSPEQRAGAYPHELSGGMAQRVAIAMGIACDPRVVLADEPTGGLDVTVQANILDHLSALLREEGSAGVIVTRELGIVVNYCTRIIVMQGGAFIEEGTVSDFLTSPRTEYGRMLVRLAREEDQKLAEERA